MNVLEMKSNLDFNTVFNFQTDVLSEHSAALEGELSTVVSSSLQCPK